MKREIQFTLTDAEGWEQTYTLPAKLALCERCNGEGKHDHPAFSNGITSSEWDGPEWDDSREAYMRGAYDVICEVCRGERVETIVDEDSCVGELKSLLEAYYADLAQTAQDEASDRHIRRMENGGRD